MADQQEANSTPDISVLIPVYNEEEGIDTCFREVSRTLDASPYSYELIFVDDGSVDGSLEIMKGFRHQEAQLKIIELKHNIGQQAAMRVGLDYCQGRAVITYDSDLQFAPSCLVPLAKQVFEGYDIAGGLRISRQDTLLFHRLPSAIGRFLINRALRIKQVDFGSVKAYSQKMIIKIRKKDPNFMVIPGAAYDLSRNFIEIPIEHRARQAGISKWSVFSRMELYFNLYVSYAQRPFEWLMAIGGGALGLSVLIALGILFFRIILSRQFAGTIIIFDLLLFAFGLLFVALSLIGEFVVRIFRSRNETPLTNVQSVYLDGDDESNAGPE